MKFLFRISSLCVLLFFGCDSNELKSIKIELEKDVLSIRVLENKKIEYNNKEYLFCDIEEVLLKDLNGSNVEDSIIGFSADSSIKKNYINCIFDRLGFIGIKSIIVNEKNSKSKSVSNEDRYIKDKTIVFVYINKSDEIVSYKIFDKEKKVSYDKLEIPFDDEGNYIIIFYADVGVSYHNYSQVRNRINEEIMEHKNKVSNLIFGLDYKDISELQREEFKSAISISVKETTCPVCWLANDSNGE